MRVYWQPGFADAKRQPPSILDLGLERVRKPVLQLAADLGLPSAAEATAAAATTAESATTSTATAIAAAAQATASAAATLQHLDEVHLLAELITAGCTLLAGSLPAGL